MIILYLLGLFGLLVYSFSQIDLNLTLFQTPFFQNFQHLMINLGYFNRPLSTFLFVLMSAYLTVFYCLLISKAENLSKSQVIVILLGLSLLTIFSYPAFSHDIFNGMFNARQIILYHANPYTTTPLMFPQDSWVRFMQWTHVTYPWGPLYLLISLPFYLLGLGKFILTLMSFKLMALLAFLGSALIISKLSSKRGVVLFILNPLIIYEALAAAHLDVIMLFFALLSWYLWQNKKPVSGLVSLLVSIGIKYATVTMFPVFVLSKFVKKYTGHLTGILIILSLFGTLVQILNRELLPHYFIVPIGFIALYPKNRKITNMLIAFTVVLLLIRYVPFLYTGQWLTIKPF